LVRDSADKLILCGDILDLWRTTITEIKRKEPMKSTYEALLITSKEVPITYVWGNHDYNIWKKEKEMKNYMKITDDFISNNIYYCHGWRFDLQQRFGYLLYGWLVEKFPILYQLFFKKPFEIKKDEEKYSIMSRAIHDEARAFIKRKKVKYLIMGHTHDPMKDDKLMDCGDMVDSLSYVIVDNGKPRLEKMARE
jgi:UDP-2,3-diacylglucosamine pyrophosphatase LpxH